MIGVVLANPKSYAIVCNPQTCIAELDFFAHLTSARPDRLLRVSGTFIRILCIVVMLAEP